MTKHLTILTMLFLGQIACGQSDLIKNIFYHLPLDKKVEDIEKVISADTANFKLKKGPVFRHYYKTSRDSFYTSYPNHSELRVDYILHEKDSVLCQTIIRFLTYDKRNISTKKMKLVYNGLVEQFKKEFSYARPEYIKGIRKQNGRETKVDEWTTYFYLTNGDRTYKASVTWFDEGKFGDLLMVDYILK